MRKVLLNKTRSKESINNNVSIPVQLNRDVSLYHDEILTDTIDTLQLYNTEKDSSTKHRFIFTLKPLCCNSLFNKITEIIYKEGSSECKVLTNNSSNGVSNAGAISTEEITRIQAIRNTEYSHDKFNLTYHCGADICNNHLLRSKEEICVQKRDPSDISKYDVIEDGNENTSQKDGFNTIGDIVRNYKGKPIKGITPYSVNHYLYTGLVGNSRLSNNIPLYIYDTVKSFEETFADIAIKRDGWMGFINPTSMHVPVSGTTSNGYYINKCMNNTSGCNFIDFAPERDLFYFTPKKNEYRKRLEYNWDYFLTYPSERVYEASGLSTSKGLPLQRMTNKNYQERLGVNGVSLITFRTPIKHNLHIDDSIYLILDDDTKIKTTVVALGSNNGKYKDYYFTVAKNDIEDILEKADSITHVKKIIDGFECDYYFRKFSKIKENLNSSINRLAFSNTIYGDEVSQIVFTSDFNVEGYRNHLGYPLTEVYLTILKSNRGYSEWYEKNDYQNENVEFSHVFGKVTSGFDMPYFANVSLPSIRRQHNIDTDKANKNGTVSFSSSSSKLEENINKDMDSFYGDLVEFNPVTLNEVVLEKIQHRFNTAQRETTNELYNTIYYDEIVRDMYDGRMYGKEFSTPLTIQQHTLNKGFANLSPEGYIYTPHHKVILGKLSDLLQQDSHTLIDVKLYYNNGNDYIFTSKTNYRFLTDDIVLVIDKKSNKLIKFKVTRHEEFNNEIYYIYCTLITGGESMVDFSNAIFYKNNINIPDYAYLLPDGSGRCLWRVLDKPSTYDTNNELYNTPFTNGAFYHYLNINFSVRRQDPFDEYEMYPTEHGLPYKNNFEISASKFDYSIADYVTENINPRCF